MRAESYSDEPDKVDEDDDHCDDSEHGEDIVRTEECLYAVAALLAAATPRNEADDVESEPEREARYLQYDTLRGAGPLEAEVISSNLQYDDSGADAPPPHEFGDGVSDCEAFSDEETKESGPPSSTRRASVSGMDEPLSTEELELSRVMVMSAEVDEANTPVTSPPAPISGSENSVTSNEANAATTSTTTETAVGTTPSPQAVNSEVATEAANAAATTSAVTNSDPNAATTPAPSANPATAEQSTVVPEDELSARIETWPLPDPVIMAQVRRTITPGANDLVQAGEVVKYLRTRYRKSLGTIAKLLSRANFDSTFVQRPGARARDRSWKLVKITVDEYLSNQSRYVVWLPVREVASLPEVIDLVKKPGKRSRDEDAEGPFATAKPITGVSAKDWLLCVANVHLACVYQCVLGTVGELKAKMGPLEDKDGNPFPDDFIVSKCGMTTHLEQRTSAGGLLWELKAYGDLVFQRMLILAGDQAQDAENELKDQFTKDGFHFLYLDGIHHFKREFMIYSPTRQGHVNLIFDNLGKRFPQTRHGTDRRHHDDQAVILQLRTQLSASEQRHHEDQAVILEQRAQLSVAEKELAMRRSGNGSIPVHIQEIIDADRAALEKLLDRSSRRNDTASDVVQPPATEPPSQAGSSQFNHRAATTSQEETKLQAPRMWTSVARKGVMFLARIPTVLGLELWQAGVESGKMP